MNRINRREFVSAAAAMGATLLLAGRTAAASRVAWREDRTVYPEGVASGDPLPDSVILWTRRPFPGMARATLTAEVSLDPDFRQVVATRKVPVLAESDWTCRALVAGLKPATVYWYRFTDAEGHGSRVGRTITAPADDDPRTVRFAFASCQSVNEGKQNAYRRMIWEDEKAPADQKLGFVLHLGDFIYEVVEYPDELPHRYGRIIYDIGRIPDARKVGNFYVPTTLEGYRVVYRGHIHDPDVQDARAHFPFICIGDNHEFSWQGWQSFITYGGGEPEPAQPLRVAANQAWWEYIPSRVRKASGPGLERFAGPIVTKVPITKLDDDGFADEPNARTAIGSMTAYRAQRYGRHVDLILTDFHSYKMRDPVSRPEANDLGFEDFPMFVAQEQIEILDGGRGYDGGRPPGMIPNGAKPVPNFRKDEAPYTVLGRPQKAWLKDRLKASTATWKIWGATNPVLDMRTDPQNLPKGLTKPWPGEGYATFGAGDFSAAFAERAEIYDLVREGGIDGFVVVSGDRHSFWAGYAAKALPPKTFDPVGIAFVTGSISAIGMAEGLEYGKSKDPLRPLFTVQRADGSHEATVNLAIKRGVRAAWEYAQSGDIDRARALTNPDNAPHLEFVDMGGHGYSVVTAAADRITTEFVCIPRPVTRAETPDGGPIRYRVVHSAARWHGGKPVLEQRILEGDPKTSV